MCAHSNTTRLADSPEGQARLLKGRIDLFGIEYVAPVWEEFLQLFDVYPTHLTIEAIMWNLPGYPQWMPC